MRRSIPLSPEQHQTLEDRANQVHPGLLEAIQSTSQRLGCPVFVVGGAPRDLVSSNQVGDLDLVVEGDGEGFARALAAALGGKMKSHPRFFTAEVELPGGRLDVATTRQECYDSPAVLPSVEPGPFKDDLRRRDFTVNTLAIELGKGPPFAVQGSYEALRDLKEHRLRVLHDESFIDDPTRILRGVRLESRLGFKLDEVTERLATGAVTDGVFDSLSSDRLRRELFRLLEPIGSIETRLQRLGELGLLSVLSRHLQLSAEDQAWIGRAAEKAGDLPADTADVEGWRLAFPALLAGLDRTAVESVAARLALRPNEREWLLTSRLDLDHALEVLRHAESRPSDVDRALGTLRSEQIALLMAVTEAPVVRKVHAWLDDWRAVQLSLTGQELLEAGIAPGAWIGRALDSTREARLNGTITAREELDFALNLLKKENSGAEIE